MYPYVYIVSTILFPTKSWRTDLCFFPDCLVDDVVVLHHLFLHRELEILQTCILLLEVDVAEAAVEENFTRVELEQEAKLSVIDHGVSSEVEQRVVEICQCLLKVAEQEIRNALLEVCDGEVLV